MRLPTCLRALLLIAATAPSWAIAAPAPWYWWHSRLDGQRYCAQTSPGSGWQKGAGPYRNLRCEQTIPDRARNNPPRFEPGQPDVRSPGETVIDHLQSK